jgi:hypothetical protein
MVDRKTLGIVDHENLFLCDLNESKLPNNLMEKFKVDMVKNENSITIL